MFKKVFFLCLSILLLSYGLAQAYSWSYNNVSWDFTLTGFSDPSNPSTSTNGPLTLTLSNISGLTLPNPPAGTYDWYIEVYSFALDVSTLVSGNDIGISGTYGPYFIGTWQAPLAASGSVALGDVYVPSLSYTYNNTTYSVGGYTVQNAIVSWELYEDANGTDLAEPGDNILYAVLQLQADNLSSTINANLTYLDNALGGADNFIDGSGSTSFKVSAVPEPATLLLTGAGLFLVGRLRRRS